MHLDPAAVRAHLANIEQAIADQPEEVVQKALEDLKRENDIKAHNAAIEAKSRRKKTIKRFLRAQALKKH
jgi:hypothetical protein